VQLFYWVTKTSHLCCLIGPGKSVVLKLDELLLALFHQTANAGQQDVPWLEDAEHIGCRTPVHIRCRQMKASG